MAGYPRVIGAAAHYYPGFGMVPYGVHGYVAGPEEVGAGFGMPMFNRPGLGMVPVQAPPPPTIQSPPWRPMVAPGTPPVGEGHVPMPLNPETFGGTWGAGGAAAGATITFSGRPQKPFKPTRLLISATKSGATAVGRLIGQVFVGTDLQQGELGNIDLETLGAGGAFDTWISFKQVEPGVWLRMQATLSAFPTAPDFETYVTTCIGHYLH